MGALAGKVDAVIAAIAARQHGAVARDQLLEAGLTPRMIAHRIRIGMLVPVHRGVYLFGYGPPASLAQESAALLACRPRALLSHRTACRLWRLPVEADATIDITVVGRKRGPLDGVRLHALSQLPRTELRWHEGLAITSPSLTLLDFAGVAGFDELEGALHEARVQRLVKGQEVRATLSAHPNRAGARALRRLLDAEGGVKLTRSKGERRLLKVLRAHGLEPDASDVAIGPYRLDFYFRAERVAVEYDSRQFHDNSKRFVGDRRKIRYLAARGILTVPLTAYELGPGREQAMTDLRAILADRRRGVGFPGQSTSGVHKAEKPRR